MPYRSTLSKINSFLHTQQSWVIQNGVKTSSEQTLLQSEMPCWCGRSEVNGQEADKKIIETHLSKSLQTWAEKHLRKHSMLHIISQEQESEATVGTGYYARSYYNSEMTFFFPPPWRLIMNKHRVSLCTCVCLLLISYSLWMNHLSAFGMEGQNHLTVAKFRHLPAY